MTACSNCSTEHDRDGDLCFRCHVQGIRFAFKGSVTPGRKGWNRTANEYKQEHFGTTSDKELEQRGIVKAKDYGW
ncbi:MAG TPA: hypothetical protein VMW08_11775 [Acidimicrobiales bacterium]|nr:hypothetical protein [Acidimicrobiales bacterium]